MRRTIQRLCPEPATAQWVRPVFGICLIALFAAAAAHESAHAFTRACAVRDLQLAILIEDRSNARDILPEKVASAVRTMNWARATCTEGKESEALAIYDSIDLGPIVAAQPPILGRSIDVTQP
jgi:hypothetical protein